jgi:Spy/CpxP family protein refolding chaperone
MFVSGLIAVAGLCGFDSVSAQEQPPNAPALQEDPMFSTLFTPELIMQHRRAIGLTDEQRDGISRLISNVQARILSMQWELLDEVEELGSITGQPRVDLDRAIDQMGSVLDKEKQIKQAHLEMLIRIKNLLTPQQQAQLAALRPRVRSGSGGPG